MQHSVEPIVNLKSPNDEKLWERIEQTPQWFLYLLWPKIYLFWYIPILFSLNFIWFVNIDPFVYFRPATQSKSTIKKQWDWWKCFMIRYLQCLNVLQTWNQKCTKIIKCHKSDCYLYIAHIRGLEAAIIFAVVLLSRLTRHIQSDDYFSLHFIFFARLRFSLVTNCENRHIYGWTGCSAKNIW